MISRSVYWINTTRIKTHHGHQKDRLCSTSKTLGSSELPWGALSTSTTPTSFNGLNPMVFSSERACKLKCEHRCPRRPKRTVNVSGLLIRPLVTTRFSLSQSTIVKPDLRMVQYSRYSQMASVPALSALRLLNHGSLPSSQTSQHLVLGNALLR